MQTYLFYDIETTGLNKAFDQILHFAAIRTDMNLRELNRYEVKVKLNLDLVPAPQAMITHLITLDETLQGVSEYEAIKKIHAWINEPGTISLGYNTLGFDDEFLRFSFYRNLLPPYTHQYANQCSRMDLYPIAALYFLFKQDILTWPGTLKLEHLNNANQFISGRSHHAMVDVEVTLELAKRFFQERDVWDYATAYFNKNTDQERSQNLQTALMINGKFGAEQNYIAPVLFLGNHYHYKNQTIWLRLDSPDMTTAFSLRKKLGEPGFILPWKERFLQHISSERQTLAAANLDYLQQNKQILADLIHQHCDYKYPIIPETDLEARLYMIDFFSNDEQKMCRQFHAANPNEKAILTEKMQNPILQNLAIRILGRHYPDALTAEQAEQFAAYRRKTDIIDFKGEKRLTADAALQEIASLKINPDISESQKKLLDELASYLLKR